MRLAEDSISRSMEYSLMPGRPITTDGDARGASQRGTGIVMVADGVTHD